MRRRRFEKTRHAVVTTLQSRIGAEWILRLVVEDEARYEQIELAVVIEIEPRRAGGPAGCGDTRFFSHVGKRAVAVVAIKNVRAVVGDVKIDITVAVEIGGGDAH